MYVGWPMNEQIPNVAIVDRFYLFTLAAETYKSSTNETIVYSASGLPSWLQFNGDSRTFSGTPSSKDAGSFEITLSGTDPADNSNISNTYLMMVATTTPLELSSSDVMITTIAKYGRTNGVDGLVVTPGQQFSIQFAKSVFTPQDGLKAFYGRSQDRTPLPNWVDFDSDSLTFSGTVPQVVSEIAPSFSYNFCFIGTDYPGYAGAVGLFNLVVGAHLLSTSFNASVKLNGTFGSSIDEPVPVFSTVFLDQTPIVAQNISSVKLQDAPSFITLNSDYVLVGTFPSTTTASNFTVVVSDIYGNSVSLPYQISSIGSLFTVSDIPNANATRGQFFSLQLMRSYFTDINSTSISVSTNSSWLSYESSNMTILGDTPLDFQQASVKIIASKGSSSDELSFEIFGVDRSVSSSSSSSTLSSTSKTTSSSMTLQTPSTTSSNNTPDVTSTSSSEPETGLSPQKRNLIIGLCLGLGGGALFACLAILLLCCYRRKDTDNSEDQENKSVSPPEPELTGPGFGTTFDIDDHGETAHQLGALNAMKLDEDNDSVALCVTHVDSSEEDCVYVDESGKPTKSWRADDNYDSSAVKKMLLEQQRRSDISLNTINTEQLFSVRIVDDVNSNRVSRQSLLADISKDTSSANIQRLDSDGNISEINNVQSNNALTSERLVNIAEEKSEFDRENTQVSSLYTLMAKLDPDVLMRDASFDRVSQVSSDKSPLTNSNDETTNRQSHAEAPIVSQTGKLDPLSPKKPLLFKNQLNSPLNNISFGEDSLDHKAKLVDFTRKGSLKDAAFQPKLNHSAAQVQIFDDDESI